MKVKLKVMILHNIISPYRNPLFEELSKKYNLTVYFCKENDKERKWSTRLEDYSFNYKILPYRYFGPFLFNPTLKKELKKEDYDVYICGDNLESFSSCLKILSFCKHKKKPFIFWSGNTLGSIQHHRELAHSLIKIFTFNIKKFIDFIYMNNVKNISKSFISYSNATTNFLSSNGFPTEKIFVGTQNYPEFLLPKPIWMEKPRKFKNKKIIFNLGYLREGKGVDYLIEAFNKLDRKDTLLLIAGTGDQEEMLKKSAKDNENIIFLGYADGVDRANYYSIADFFVFPTLCDIWGHVVTESLYYGIPVICTDKAEAKELIEEGKTGFIVPDKNSNALAEAMEKLLDNPNLLKQMRENVKKIPKSKIVHIQTTVNTFDKAIKYALNTHETPKPQTKKTK